MRFTHPEFLWALSLLLIPLIIHLFNFKRHRKVAFSNLRMLKRIETQSRKSRQLKKWLVLLARMLALAALVIAFAKPFVPAAIDQSSALATSIYIDHSFSMNSPGEKGPLLEEAKQLARDLVQRMPNTQKVRILGNESAVSEWSSKENALKKIDAIQLSHYPNSMDALWAQVQTDREVLKQHLILISDFQTQDDEPWGDDHDVLVRAIQLKPTDVQNLSIDSVWLASPVNQVNERIELKVRLRNHSKQPLEGGSLFFNLNGKQQAVESFEIGGEQQLITDLHFTTSQNGWLDGHLRVNDPEISFDNDYFFCLYIKPTYDILQLSNEPSAFQTVFENDPHFKWSSIDPLSLDVSTLSSRDLIILNQLESLSPALQTELHNYMEAGGTILFIPSEEELSYHRTALGGLVYQERIPIDLRIHPKGLKHSFYRGVFAHLPENLQMPLIKQIFRTKGPGQAILETKNGLSALQQIVVGDGKLLQFTFPMSTAWSNFKDNQLFVLTALQAVFNSGQEQQLAYKLNREAAIPLKAENSQQPLLLVHSNQAVILQTGNQMNRFRFWLNENLVEDGIYSLQFKGDERELARLALNYDRAESRPDYLNETEIEQLFGTGVKLSQSSENQLVESIVSASEKRGLWKLFVLLCLVFLLIEILLLRLYKS